MGREHKNNIKEPGLLEQLFPTETGLMQSLGQSKTLIIMLVVGCLLFAGLALFLLKMASMQ
ncbi:hypothetical protein [Thalassomonas haliotis]|uniref:Uncharacterized protein n=1 Tax=Thalassomonas haliotis TaxID=485448 RepID=A0ABY7VAR2_9GAMM|nr:hypothetical protein [Thalassomonas haliotis]WDE09983.1 hypothetical protein H3N35_16955 [Thalassomonas haliotis]